MHEICVYGGSLEKGYVLCLCVCLSSSLSLWVYWVGNGGMVGLSG